MEEVEIPPYFLCPISLEIMRDPVTACTGITYDRESIERWIFSGKNMNCPVTKQALADGDLTPNHTLRRLIQAWCSMNASKGIERIPTPRPPIDRAQITKILNDAKIPETQVKSLQQLKLLVSESERNKRSIEAAGAADVLAAIIKNSTPMEDVSDEALSLLFNLQMSEETLRHLISRNVDLVGSFTQILQQGSYQSRAYATLLLKPIFEIMDPIHLTSVRREMFQEIVRVIRDQISPQATKAALQILADLGLWGRNRIKAVEAGGVPAVVELLLQTSERRPCEMMLVLLDQLCACADGRAELLGHAAGIAVVSKKILRVSHAATERAVRILSSIARFSATSAVLQEMLQVGVVSKLCMVLQVDCSVKAKDKAKEILVLHSRAWRKSTCVPVYFLSSYPGKEGYRR